MKIVCITSPLSVGCSFVDWSMHFLAGESTYYSVTEKQWVNLASPESLFTVINAHGHKKNHSHGRQENIEFINQFRRLKNARLCSNYPVIQHIDVVANELKLDCQSLTQPEIWQSIQQYQKEDYLNIFNDSIDSGAKVVYISCQTDPATTLYFSEPRAFDRFLTQNKSPTSIADMNAEFQQLFFSQSTSTWNELNLTDIWDVRERMALDLRPFATPVHEITDFTKNHLWINCVDLWYRGPMVIKKIMTYIDLPIDHSRYSHWTKVYAHWQQMQLDKLEFSFNINHIIDCIINNWHYELGTLSLTQEAIIQHLLIYKHNLNLKTWQLEKFPSNTKDLHLLLEPNIHSTVVLY